MNFSLKKLLWKHRNNKLSYYLSALIRELTPQKWLQTALKSKLSSFHPSEIGIIQHRVNYYNKLTNFIHLSSDAQKLLDLKLPAQQRVYYFDSKEYTRYFDQQLKARFVFGDVIQVPPEPSIVKSRPIDGDNENSVLLKLNKVRHFLFVKDSRDFRLKRDLLVGRAVVNRPHRIKFYKMYFHHPMCDLGQINRNQNPQWIKEKLSIEQQLKYKFILCIEGNDVATNLKWVMSSNSLAVMPKPKYETWFMEGTLIPDYHYVQIKDDYSDLEERLTYYIRHPHEADQIIENAHAYVRPFLEDEFEDVISLLVLEKYFYKTGQLKPFRPDLFN